MVDNIQKSDPEQLNLFDLHWDDILLQHVAIHLSIEDLFILRCCSRTSLEFVNSHFKAMKKLNLSGHYKAHKLLKILEPHCKKLEVLNLERCSTVEDEHLVNILANNTKLRIVNLSECIKLSLASLNEILTKCKNVDELTVSKCHWFMSASTEIMALRRSKITKFDMAHCDFLSRCPKMLFLRKWYNLKVLSLAYIMSLSDVQLIQISNNCPQLEHINLTACLDVTDRGIEALANGCKKLKSMNIRNCSYITEYVLAPLRTRGMLFDRNEWYDPPPYDVVLLSFYGMRMIVDVFSSWQYMTPIY